MFKKVFKNRKEAAKKLAKALGKYKGRADTVVLGLLRGGIIPAYEVAKSIEAPLDFVILRKIGAPEDPEFAIGAITEDDVVVLDSEAVSDHKITQEYIDETAAAEKKEVSRRLGIYRKDYPKLDLKDRIAIIIDDGIATGTTIRAAIKSARARGAKKVIVAVPVCPTESLTSLKNDTDKLICIYPSDMLFAVGAFYDDFPQVEDKEVLRILKKAKK